ncbi:MAG TPA: glycosyltransferase family 4 protein [Mycobacteriales bacterium]|nr:glycosyltransferase family 4 protein [Mycobacteriales bacterium]
MRRLLWASLADQRPGREQRWLSLLPDTRLTALAGAEPLPPADWIPATYRRPVRRFVEAGALAWVRELDGLTPEYDWVGSLELCSLVTGQASAYARRHRLRQVVVTWENDPRQPLYSLPPYRTALRRSLDNADLFLCLVESAADHLRVLGVDDDRLRVVRPGIDTSFFRPAPALVAEPVIAFVSPVAANKGIDRVLDAFALVRAKIPDARLRVLGDGPLVSMVRGQGVEHMGRGDAARVASVLQEAAVFVTAPRSTWKWSEQFGLAYLEAMACGLPVVTTVCGTNHEIVVPPNERVVDEAEALADALIGFLSDPTRRAAVGASNRRYVEEHHELGAQCARMGAALASVER